MCMLSGYFINFSFQQLLKNFHRLFQYFPNKTFFINKINAFYKRFALRIFSDKLCHLFNLSRLPMEISTMQISFLDVWFQKKRFSCWEHILCKVLSQLFIYILFRVFICGFLDFIIASFLSLVGFIFFI